jgi:acyl-CoA synthetase (AMP-forming)/AMP-acid ligase II
MRWWTTATLQDGLLAEIAWILLVLIAVGALASIVWMSLGELNAPERDEAEEQLTRPRQTGSLRVMGHGGSPVAVEVVRRARRALPGVHLMHLYGATETAPLVTALLHEERWIDTPRAKSCGQPVVGVDVAVRHPDGSVCADGDVGEVTVRGPNVTIGYWNKPEQTAAALRYGWYWTGDLGRVDEDGYLYLLDRSKDMIITGGENVYCTEVEDAIYSHPMVLEAAVVGIPDER